MSDERPGNRTGFDDLQNEIAGRAAGRIARFLPPSKRADIYGEKSKTKAGSVERTLSELQRYLEDSAYKAAWEQANAAADRLQTRLTDLSDALAGRIETLESLIEDLEGGTATTEDGGLVFRDANGQLVDQHGFPLSPEAAAAVQNPEDAKSYEQYRDARDALRAAREKQDRYAELQDQVTRWKDRLNDPNDPLSPEELDEAQRFLDHADKEVSRAATTTPDFNTQANAGATQSAHDLEFSGVAPAP